MSQISFGLFGAGGSGREVMPYTQDSVAKTLGLLPADVEVFFVETFEPATAQVNGYPLLSMAQFLNRAGPLYFNVAIGDSRVRETIVHGVGAAAQALSICSPHSVFYDYNTIGEGAVLCPFTLVTSNVTIGRFFQANYFSSISHDSVIGDFVTFGPGVRCNGRIHIGDHAYVGANAMLKPGTVSKPLRIGKGAVIGMGAVVTKDVPDNVTVIGNPARPL